MQKHLSRHGQCPIVHYTALLSRISWDRCTGHVGTEVYNIYNKSVIHTFEGVGVGIWYTEK